LKPASGAAGAEIVPTKLLAKLLGAVNDAHAALDLRFGREALAAFTGDFEADFVPILDVDGHMNSWVEGCGCLAAAGSAGHCPALGALLAIRAEQCSALQTGTFERIPTAKRTIQKRYEIIYFWTESGIAEPRQNL